MAATWKPPLRVRKRYRLIATLVLFACPLILGWFGLYLTLFPPIERKSWWELGATALSVISFGALCADKWMEMRSTGCMHKTYVDCVLHSLHEHVWEKELHQLAGPPSHHRVTLFEVMALPPSRKIWRGIKNAFIALVHKDESKRELWTHRLIPRTRVPDDERKPHRQFHVHSEHESLCEGFAGSVFSHKSSTLVSSELPELAFQSNDEMLKEFAGKTYDALDMVKKHRYNFRIIGGANIFVQGRRHWVLMLDSTDPKALGNTTFEKESTDKALKMLSKMLEEAST